MDLVHSSFEGMKTAGVYSAIDGPGCGRARTESLIRHLCIRWPHWPCPKVDRWQRGRLKLGGSTVGSFIRCLFLTSAAVRTCFHLSPSFVFVVWSDAAVIQKLWHGFRRTGSAGFTSQCIGRCGLMRIFFVLGTGCCFTTDLLLSDVGEH